MAKAEDAPVLQRKRRRRCSLDRAADPCFDASPEPAYYYYYGPALASLQSVRSPACSDGEEGE